LYSTPSDLYMLLAVDRAFPHEPNTTTTLFYLPLKKTFGQLKERTLHDFIVVVRSRLQLKCDGTR